MLTYLNYKKFYEAPHLRDPARYTGVEEERANMTASWIPSDSGSLLDVGCGNGLLTNKLKCTQLVVGGDLSRSALKYVRVPCCQLDVVDLPFGTSSFDTVVATEVIEHLDCSQYKTSLSELVRVARKYIIISVPNNERLTACQCICPACYCRFHKELHMRSFDATRMLHLFDQLAPMVKMVRTQRIVRTYTFFPISEIRTIFRGSESFPGHAICPQCAFHIGTDRNKNDKKGKYRSISAFAKFQNFVKMIWPTKRVRFKWLIALYKK